MANSRIYVQRSIRDKFTEAFKKAATARKLGNPTQSGINHGPQADSVQYETVLKYIDIGKQTGKVILEGNAEGNNMVHPVVFADQPEDSRIMKEEIFGPVVVINAFENEDEVIEKANAS